MPPISPVKDENTGRTVKSATLTPFRTITMDEIYRLIVNTQIRAYPFYKAPEWVPHKKLLLNSIDF